MNKIKYKKGNIVLIGMPGAGKSTIGVILAKTLGFSFCDTDLIIQKNEGHTLQEIISEKGLKYFLVKEKDIVSSLDLEQHVIAPGGSVIYHSNTIDHLKKNGLVIYLDVPYKELKKRIANMKTRGIVMSSTQSFQDIFDERATLYKKFADKTLVCNKKNMEKIVEEIIFIVQQ